MKYVLTVLLLSTLAFAQDSAPSSGGASSAMTSAIPTDAESTRKARALLDQAIEALGGQAYLNVRDFSQQGRSYSFHRGEPNSVGILFTRVGKLWDKDRVEYTAKREFFNLGGIPLTEKAHVITIYSGDMGYQITNRGIDNIDSKEMEPYLRRRRFSVDIVLREWLNQPGVALFYEGQTVAAQKQAEQVTVMNAKNEAVTLYFDLSTHLPVKKSFTWRDPADKQRNVEEEIYDNYRKAQNVMTPYDTTRFFNGEMAAQFFLTNASFNQGLSDTLFDPKAAASADKH